MRKEVGHATSPLRDLWRLAFVLGVMLGFIHDDMLIREQRSEISELRAKHALANVDAPHSCADGEWLYYDSYQLRWVCNHGTLSISGNGTARSPLTIATKIVSDPPSNLLTLPSVLSLSLANDPPLEMMTAEQAMKLNANAHAYRISFTGKFIGADGVARSSVVQP